MIEKSVAQDDRPSTREIVVGDRYARLLAEDLGVKETTARTAFLGEPQKRALGVVEWALRHAPDSPEKRARMVLMWAKKRGAGAFGPKPDIRINERQGPKPRPEPQDRERYERIARTIARMWVENPRSLAEAVMALEKERNGNGRS